MDIEVFRKSVLSNYKITKQCRSVEPYGSGHINDTYKVVFGRDEREDTYIFQRINTNIFKNPDELMSNISRVVHHIAKKQYGVAGLKRRCIHLFPTKEWKYFCVDDEGGCWRAYRFIDGARTYDILKTEEQAYRAAKAFGEFQMLISDLPQPRLFETIPNFHNTPSRLKDFDEALAKDVCGRAELAKAEIEFVQNTRHIASKVVDLMADGTIPERITHNDTKLNNVLLDDETMEGVCVIDLDTVMPGSALYDFGDMMRTSLSPAAEDEKDLTKIEARTNIFRQLVKGYLEGCQGCLNATEMELLPFSGQLITFEIGVRFLTDFLSGDVYFKTHRENHNLDRCRTQFTLVQRLMEKAEEFDRITREFI